MGDFSLFIFQISEHWDSSSEINKHFKLIMGYILMVEAIW